MLILFLYPYLVFSLFAMLVWSLLKIMGNDDLQYLTLPILVVLVCHVLARSAAKAGQPALAKE